MPVSSRYDGFWRDGVANGYDLVAHAESEALRDVKVSGEIKWIKLVSFSEINFYNYFFY